MDNNLKLENHFQDIREISATAAEYLDAQLFQLDVTDTLQPQEVLVDLYSILIEELTEFGIYFSIEESDLLADFYTAKNIYYLRRLVDVNTLTELLISNEEYKNKIEMLINDIEIDTDLISEIIELTEHYFDQEYLERLLELHINVYSDNRFRKHCEAVLDSIELIDKTNHTITPEEVTEFTSMILTNRNLFKQCVERLIDYVENQNSTLGDIDRSVAEKAITNYDRDKMFDIDSWTILESDTIPEEYKQSLASIRTAHRENNNHHIEYYLVRNKVPTITETILLVSHFNESDATEQSVSNEINELLKKGVRLLNKDVTLLLGNLVMKGVA